MSSKLQPLLQSRRDRTIDILRGFALAGVLLIFCISDNAPTEGNTNSFVDELISWPRYILIESRMYTMLIIIFGMGFHVQLEKAKQQGKSLVPVFSRRLVGLLFIGFIHATLLSSRDILMFYALSGIVLLLARKATTRQLLVGMLVLFYVIFPLIQYNVKNVWPQVAGLVEPDNYPNYLSYNWEYFKLYHQVYLIYAGMLFHFMLGFMISKSGLFQKIKENRLFRRKLFFISLGLTAVFIPFFYFLLPSWMPGIARSMANPLVKFFFGILYRSLWEVWMLASVTLYATMLIMITTRKKAIQPLAAFGQMALSNYLIQSIVLVPWLLLTNEIRNLTPSEGIIVFIIVFAFQLLFSAWWMTRYSLGPFEWLLRSFTYWKWQPLRRPVENEFNNEKQVVTFS